jgi:hypothetical protein
MSETGSAGSARLPARTDSGEHLQAVGTQLGDYTRPTRRIGEGAVDENHGVGTLPFPEAVASTISLPSSRFPNGMTLPGRSAGATTVHHPATSNDFEDVGYEHLYA